ncbi:2,4-dienoyl-CoA reductase-like NADH-dependent reductase (Old Yellow Enzyme family) [Mumia flava]|uniref:2,4-dienoyl-CoA reductase-like NADH-dependent reductase (Old Yellow Enzyme family) n=1 Tax=Mumia flava TaxID=1348852 RepID=A0A2M9BJD4_9ACTN|nr:FAD-dependent oxidoreductase [Mumia flava]PJJ58043.1 2,4-dienoyl-CoA reductase-like NADH-dependent reductase (Old Yellow Enzyme family) [Mumia flava]
MTGPDVGTPLTVRDLTLRNRVVGAPMERNLCDLAGRVTPAYAAYLEARAAGGTALVFTESSYVRADSRARLRQMAMSDDGVVPGVRMLADAVHRHGSLLGVELNHAGRVVPRAVSQRQPVGPSPVPCVEIGGDLPRELGLGEIDELVEAFADAAQRALDGGADVLSVHAAHGYLIGQFLSPRSNHRDDRYCSPTAFLDDVLVAVRDRIGPRVPLFLRWSAFEGLPGGRDRDDALATITRTRLDLVDVVDLSAGTYGAGQWITPSGEVEEAYLAETARRYREETGLLVGLAGRITRPETAQRLVAERAADLVAVARALHADPTWARHAVAGTQPRPCIACNQGCADVVFAGNPLWCTVNPRTGHEAESDGAGSVDGARVLVVGGGPAGLEAAATLAERGASVILAEATSRLGGQVVPTAAMPSRPQLGRILVWWTRRLESLGVTVLLDTPLVGSEVAERFEVDAVVDATGGVDNVPSVVGDHDRLVGIRAWLADPTDDAEVAVWGADRAATYTADLLRSQRRRVVLVSTEQSLAAEAGARERLHAVERLTGDDGVELVLGHTLEQVGPEALVVADPVGRRRSVESRGPILVSQGSLPLGLTDVDPDLVVETAGEAGGSRSLDASVASGHDAALRTLARLLAPRPRARART